MPAVCNSMLPRSLSLGYHAYICILSSVYSNLYHIFFFTYNWSHKLELLYTFMFSIFLFGIFNYLFIRLTLIIVFVMLKLHDFLSLLKKYPYKIFKNKYESFSFCIQLQTTYIMDGDGMILFYCGYFLWAVISQQFIIPQRNLPVLPEYNQIGYHISSFVFTRIKHFLLQSLILL